MDDSIPKQMLSSPWKRPEPEGNKENESPDEDITPLDLSTYDKPLFQELEDKRSEGEGEEDSDGDDRSDIQSEAIPQNLLQQYYSSESKGKRAVSPGAPEPVSSPTSSRQSWGKSNVFMPIVKLEVDELQQCSLCPLKFECDEDLAFHMQFHKSTPKKNQDSEETSSISADVLTSPQSKSCQITLCFICGKDCVHQSRLRDHLRIHTGEKPYTCKVCNKSFGTSSGVRRHEAIHDQKPWHCTKCNKFFMKEFALKIHFTKQHTQKEEAQAAADATNNAPSIQSMHGSSAESKNQEEEPKMIVEPRLEYLSRRIEPRKEENRKRMYPVQGLQNYQQYFQCHQCPKTFYSPKILQLHLRSHSVKKVKEKFPCYFCPKEFASKLNLNNHTKKNHANIEEEEERQREEFPMYQCEYCDKTTASIKYLKIHEKLHTQGRPYCEICDLNFATKGCLGRHRQKFHSNLNAIQ